MARISIVDGILLGVSLVPLMLDAGELAADRGENLVGSWYYEGEAGDPLSIECPDFIDLMASGNYAIRNDCYGLDRFDPKVETGNWILDPASDTLTLLNRQLLGSYSIGDGSAILTASVRFLSAEQLQLCFRHDGHCESWKRSSK